VDPRARLRAARQAVREGRYEQALSEFVWFHDHALEHEPALYGVRLSFALSDWVELGKVFPEARRKLEEIRDRKSALLAAGKGDRALFHDVESINQSLDREKETYRLFKTMLRTAPLNAAAWFHLAQDAIVGAGDFELAARFADPPEDALLGYSEMLNRRIADLTGDDARKRMARDALVSIYVDDARRMIAILKGIGKSDEARACREWAVALIEDRRIRRLVNDALAKLN
jgi:hypothetical protein